MVCGEYAFKGFGVVAFGGGNVFDFPGGCVDDDAVCCLLKFGGFHVQCPYA